MLRSDRFAHLCLFALALAVRLGYCHYAGGIGRSGPDGFREYTIAAQRLLTQGVLSSPLLAQPQPDPQPSDLLPPLYVGIVALTYKLLGVQTYAATLALHLLNAAATSLAAVIVGLIARRLAGNVAGWLAGILVALHPLAFGYTNYTWDTALFTLGVALSVWASLRLSDGPPRIVRHLWFGGGLGVLALLNPAWTPAYPLLVLWPLARRRETGQWRPVVRAVGVAVLGWALVLAPWTVRNYISVGQLSYVRGGLGFEFWLGVCPQVDGAGNVYLSQYPLLNADQQQKLTTLGERQYIRDATTRAWQAIRTDPWRFVRLSLWRAADFWTGTVFTHTDGRGGHWPEGRRAGLTVLLAAEVAVVVLFLLTGRVSRDLRWLVAMLVLFSVVYMLTHVELRFRAPVTPVISTILACAGAVALRLDRRSASATPCVERSAAGESSPDLCISQAGRLD